MRDVVSEKVFEAPEAEDAVLICGLPGSGYVGKLAADHLVSAFKLKRVAEFSSPTFPPQVSVREDGTTEPLRGELYFAPSKKGTGLFVFTAEAQPTTSEGENDHSDAVEKFARPSVENKVNTLADDIT